MTDKPMTDKPMSATQVLYTQQAAAQAMAQYTSAQQAQMQQQWATPMNSAMNSVASNPNYTWTTTGNDPEWAREYEVTKIVKRAKNGYFFIISVDVSDNVFYRVWKGGWFPFLVAKTFKAFAADIDGNKSTWNSVTKRTHLPATIGSAYEMIDGAIKGDMEDRDHNRHIKEMLKTKPENLKMIGSLEKLAEGDVDAKDDDPAVSSNASSNWVAGSSFAPPGNTITFQNPPVQSGTITGVSTLEAEKIVLNGTDLSQVVSDKIKEATDEMLLKLADIEEDVKEVSAP